MAQYRKIDTRMWGDAKFRTLSEKAKFLWIFLLTGPDTTSLPGVLVGGPAKFSESLCWDQKGFLKAFAEVSRRGMARADWEARFLWVPNAIRYNAPQSPNVVISWKNHWDAAPECELKAEAFQVFRDSMEAQGPAFLKAFLKATKKACEKVSRNQDQDQDQDQDPLTSFEGGAGGPHERTNGGRATGGGTGTGGGGGQSSQNFSLTSPEPAAKRETKPKAKRMIDLPEDWKPNAEHYRKCESDGFSRDWVDKQFELMRDWAEANGKRYISWDAMFRNWLARAMDGSDPDSRRISGRRKSAPPPRESRNPAHQPFPEPKEPPATREQKLAGLEIGKELLKSLNPGPPRANGKKPPASSPESPVTAPSGQNGTPPAETTESSM